MLSARRGANVVVSYFGTDWGSDPAGPQQYHDAYPAKKAYEKPYGFDGQPSYFALWARRYMYEYGLTADQLGALAVQQRRRRGGRTVALSLREHAILRMLVEEAGNVVGTRALLQRSWGTDRLDRTERVRRLVGRLRRKLGMTPDDAV